MKNGAAQAPGKLVVVALAGSILLASLGISIATVALPSLAMVFSVDVQQVQWVVLAYLLAVTAAIVAAGRMGDRYGSRRVLIVGLVLFTSASASSALAPGLNWLIASRVVQGLGAAILMSLPMAIAKGLIGKQQMGTMMGLFGAMSAVGTAAGPSLGGALIGALGWRSAFAALALCGVCMLAVALRGIPQEKAGSGPTINRMDWTGALWLSILLLCFALLATDSKVGLGLQPWMLLGLAAVALAALIRTELTAVNPLVSLRLVRGRMVVASLLMNMLVGAIMMSTLVVGPFFLSFGLGLSEAETGMVMAVGPIAAALAGVPAGRATDRFGANRTLVAGLLLAVGGLYGLAVLPALIGVPGYVLALVLITPGFQLFLAANNTAVMTAAEDEHRGLFAGLLGLTRNLGFMAGASLLPLLFASLLGSHGLAGSSMQVIGEAFSTTFLVTVGLAGLAVFLAMLGSASLCPASGAHRL